MDEYLESMGEDMTTVSASLQKALGNVRTGRATPKLLDGLQIEIANYGAVMPINQLATVQAPDARLLVVTPWDKTTLNEIERGIVAAGLGLNPSNDGQVIRVPVPALTQERRQELVKQVRRAGEEAKVRLRQVRREYNDIFKNGEKDGDLSEDDNRRLQALVQEATDTNIGILAKMVESKEAEVLEV
jgi:ribosome recycling factor